MLSIAKSKPHQEPKTKIRVRDLKGFKCFKQMMPFLDRLHDTYQHSSRILHYDQFVCLVLFYFFKPILTSLRGLKAATDLKKVQKTLGIKATSRTCLSEAFHLFDASLLEPILAELALQAIPLETDPDLRMIEQEILAVDGSLLPALPKMLWALWVDDELRAAKLHLSLSVLKQVPRQAAVTDGNANARCLQHHLEDHPVFPWSQLAGPKRKGAEWGNSALWRKIVRMCDMEVGFPKVPW
jgi:hypothetical protein